MRQIFSLNRLALPRAVRSHAFPWVMAVAWLAFTIQSGAGVPSVFWANDPVKRGETIVLIGEDLNQGTSVEAMALPNGPPGDPSAMPFVMKGKGVAANIVQTNRQSLKFVVPEGIGPGVLAYRISTASGNVTGLVNRPQVWWVQGDCGTNASPGGWLRLFGKNLVTKSEKGFDAQILLKGPITASIHVSGDVFSATCDIPTNCRPGKYTLFLHNGSGGTFGWSEPVPLVVAEAPAESAWPKTTFNVVDYGAKGDGIRDDTASIQAALKASETNHGGVVLLPRGRYRISDALQVPRFTVLRGERREWVCLAWTDFINPPLALVRGSNSFGLEGLTMYADNYNHVIVGDFGDQPDSGDVFLRQLTIRADQFRGHLKPAEVSNRFAVAQKLSSGGGDAVRMGGRNIEITGCDIYGSGRPLNLSRVRGGRISNNRFFNGRWGWYTISGSDGLIFESNELSGADLMSAGGGLNCLDRSPYSQNVYFCGNKITLLHGWDREAFTSDAPGASYFGGVRDNAGTEMTLIEEPKWSQNYTNAAIFILDGRGAGQFRRVVGYSGRTVDFDRPWDVAPDPTSIVSITMFQGHYLLLQNTFSDVGAVQFYGTSIECIVAQNEAARMQGFIAAGLNYHGYQPSWFCQILNNDILEGNNYYWSSADNSTMTVRGQTRTKIHFPMNMGAVVKGNHLANNAFIGIDGDVRDAVVESNLIEHTSFGVSINGGATNILLRANTFVDVSRKVVDGNPN